MIVLLLNVVESQFDDNLAKGSIGLTALNSLGVPNNIIYLCGLPLFIVIFTNSAQRERDPYAYIASKLFSISLRDGLLFKRVNNFVLGHVYKNFLTSRILGFDDEANLWLNNGSTLWVNNRLAVFI